MGSPLAPLYRVNSIAMNHLAHAFLAGEAPAAVVGNLSGDFVRGPVDHRFEPGIAAGIRLHRHIDTFTDSHALTRRSRKRFLGGQRRVAGIVIDVYYDHLLFQHWDQYSDESFSSFCRRVYQTLTIHQSTAPDDFRNYIPWFVQRDLLASCATLDGVDRVIARLAERWQRKPELGRLLCRAGSDARDMIDDLQDDFLGFFPQLVRSVETFNAQSCER